MCVCFLRAALIQTHTHENNLTHAGVREERTCGRAKNERVATAHSLTKTEPRTLAALFVPLAAPMLMTYLNGTRRVCPLFFEHTQTSHSTPENRPRTLRPAVAEPVSPYFSVKFRIFVIFTNCSKVLF